MWPEEPRVLDEARRVEERTRTACARAVRRASSARVVVLDVELPGDPAPVEPVEDRGAVAEASVRVARRPGHPGQWLATLPSVRGGEEAVEQDVLVGDVPVEGQVAVVVVAHHAERSDRLAADEAAADEAVHAPARVLDPVDAARRDGRSGPGAAAEPERAARTAAGRATADGHAGALRDPVGARIGPEVVVERVVLLHQHHEVLDRRGRRPAPRRACGRRASAAASDRGEEGDAAAHGRTS